MYGGICLTVAVGFGGLAGAAGGGRTSSYSCFSAVGVTSGVAVSCHSRTIIALPMKI